MLQRERESCSRLLGEGFYTASAANSNPLTRRLRAPGDEQVPARTRRPLAGDQRELRLCERPAKSVVTASAFELTCSFS